MHRSQLQTVDGTVMVTIPETMLASLGLHANSPVELSIEGGRLVIEAPAKPRYTLAELLAQCDENAPPTDEDREWLNQPAVGREAI